MCEEKTSRANIEALWVVFRPAKHIVPEPFLFGNPQEELENTIRQLLLRFFLIGKRRPQPYI